MITDNELRDRIARTNPVASSATTQPVTSPGAQALLEEIMNTPLTSEPRATNHEHTSATRPWWMTAGAAAAVVAVVAVGVGLLTRGDDGSTADAPPPIGSTVPEPTAAPGKLKVIELTTGVDDAMASCAVLDPTIVATAPVAFRGTADMVEGEIVTLTIDHWYVGGDAQVATLVAPAGMEALIGGIAFEPGTSYIVAAYDGVVSYCGMTGEATPELEAIYSAAFPG